MWGSLKACVIEEKEQLDRELGLVISLYIYIYIHTHTHTPTHTYI